MSRPGTTPVEVRRADPGDAGDAAAIVALTDAYARDPMGGGEPLPPDAAKRLPDAITGHGGVHVLLARVDDEDVGICTCVVSFSTFAAAPILNIHDIAVLAERRGGGVGRALLDAAEELARGLGCARMSLEVLEHNPAKHLYERAGFEPRAEFWVRDL